MAAGIDVELLRGLRSGDHEAWRTLFHRCHPLVMRYIRGRWGGRLDQNEWDDIAADAWRRAYRAIGGFQARSSLETWLISLVKHAGMDHFRSRKRRGPDKDTALKPDLGRTADAPDSQRRGRPDEVLTTLIEKEGQERLDTHMTTLSEDHREVITLRVLMDMSGRETAQVLGRSTDAVKMLLFRAMRQLSARLREDDYYSQ